jgi:hypothetical protein
MSTVSVHETGQQRFHEIPDIEALALKDVEKIHKLVQENDENEYCKTFGPSNSSFKNPKPGSLERKLYASKFKNSGICALQEPVMTEPYHPETHDARLKVHLDEYERCIVWCIQAGKDFHPAFEHKQKAPHDIENFYFAQAPWHSDGSVNSMGVPPAPSDYPRY